jgi:hypothetical protein
VETKVAASRPIVKSTNFRTTPVPAAGSGDIKRDSTVVAMKAKRGTTYPGQFTFRVRVMSQPRHASASKIWAPAMDISTAAALATVSPKIHVSRLWDIGGFYSI